LRRRKCPDFVSGSLFCHALVQFLVAANADITFLQKSDNNAHRTNYRNIAREMSQILKMNYVFGCEFEELEQGSRLFTGVSWTSDTLAVAAVTFAYPSFPRAIEVLASPSAYTIHQVVSKKAWRPHGAVERVRQQKGAAEVLNLFPAKRQNLCWHSLAMQRRH
jgi:hypothetical protein